MTTELLVSSFSKLIRFSDSAPKTSFGRILEIIEKENDTNLNLCHAQSLLLQEATNPSLKPSLDSYEQIKIGRVLKSLVDQLITCTKPGEDGLKEQIKKLSTHLDYKSLPSEKQKFFLTNIFGYCKIYLESLQKQDTKEFSYDDLINGNW